MRGMVFLFIALLFALPVMAQEVGSISGTVSTEDGNPVAGAGVAIWDDERNHMETRTDEDGAFAFERVPAGAWNIRASMEGMEAAQDQIEVAANENTEVLLVLGDDGGGGGDDGVGSVSGTVFNQRREAVAGAAVTLMNDRREVIGETETDDEGAFSFEEVPAGGYTVLAQHGDLSALERIRVVGDQNTEVRLLLGGDGGGGGDQIGTVIGVVTTEDGEAAVRTIVHLWIEAQDRAVIAARGLTDERGGFAFRVAEGDYHITAELEDVGVAEDDINVAVGEITEVNLVLGEGELNPRYNSVDDQDVALPISALLLDSYPNPFNAIATVEYQLPFASNVYLSVFNTDGRLIGTLINSYQNAGEHQIEFNADSFPTGTYILRLEAGSQTQTMKLMLLK